MCKRYNNIEYQLFVAWESCCCSTNSLHLPRKYIKIGIACAHFIWHIMDFMAFFVSLHRINPSLKERDGSFRSTKIRSHPAKIFSFFWYSIAAGCIPYLDWRNRYFLVRFSRFVFQGGNNIPAHPPNRFSLGVR